jgi:outer membrane protein
VTRPKLGALALRTLVISAGAAVVLATPAMAQTPAAPAQTTPATQAPPPFPADARVGYVNLQTIFNQAALGQQAAAQVQKLQDTLNAQLQQRDKDIQALADKIQAQQSTAAPSVLIGWNNDLQRMQREAQFAQQEAQVQVDQLKQGLLDNFEKEVVPVIESVRVAKGLWLVFSVQNAAQNAAAINLIAAAPGLDLSGEVVTRLNAKK